MFSHNKDANYLTSWPLTMCIWRTHMIGQVVASVPWLSPWLSPVLLLSSVMATDCQALCIILQSWIPRWSTPPLCQQVHSTSKWAYLDLVFELSAAPTRWACRTDTLPVTAFPRSSSACLALPNCKLCSSHPWSGHRLISLYARRQRHITRLLTFLCFAL